MYLYASGVYAQILHVRAPGQRVKYRPQCAVIPPLGESRVHRLPETIGRRQLTPLSTAPDNPEHPVEHVDGPASPFLPVAAVA